MNYTTPEHVRDLLIKVHPSDYKAVRGMIDEVFKDDRIDVYQVKHYTFAICHYRRRLWVQGKISATYSWGAPGHDFNAFIIAINQEYLLGKLGITEVYDKRASFAALRRELKTKLPWYRHMDAQKRIRELLAHAFECDFRWADVCDRLFQEKRSIRLLWELDEDFKETLFDIIGSSHDFYCTKMSDETKILCKEFATLQGILKSQKVTNG